MKGFVACGAKGIMVTDDAGYDGIDFSTTSPARKDASGSRNDAQDASDLLKGFEHPINLR